MGERKISTFVFLDSEATGLPDSRTRMTELSLVAAHREVIIFVFFFLYAQHCYISYSVYFAAAINNFHDTTESRFFG